MRTTQLTILRAARLIGCSLSLLLAQSATAQEFPQPTREHQEMAREAGTWDAKVQMWMDPSAPAMKSTGTETCESFGGFWMTSHFEGNFGGQPFEGISQTTYDPEAKQYVSTWIDTMASTLLVSRGTYDPETHTLTLLSEEHTCCMTGQRKRLKMTTRYTDADHKHFEIHETLAGANEWAKTMEIDYTRRK